jgi:hypothetical protein
LVHTVKYSQDISLIHVAIDTGLCITLVETYRPSYLAPLLSVITCD